MPTKVKVLPKLQLTGFKGFMPQVLFQRIHFLRENDGSGEICHRLVDKRISLFAAAAQKPAPSLNCDQKLYWVL
jgi:hypothetical protein